MNMNIRNIGITSPGDMGQAVALRLKNAGFGVYTSLTGRSARTRELAAAAGVTDCGTVRELVAHVDVVLSILNPAAAIDKAKEVAGAIAASGKPLPFIDCNATAPETMKTIDGILRTAGGRCVDAGIIGPPPRGENGVRIYVSGPDAAVASALACKGLEFRNAGTDIGDASALKMCYASITKGAIALGVELFVTAQRLGVLDVVNQELAESQGTLMKWLEARTLPFPSKAYRWVPEMNEIARTFSDAGLTPRMLEGAADVFEFVAQNPIGKESPEEARAKNRRFEEIVKALAGSQ